MFRQWLSLLSLCIRTNFDRSERKNIWNHSIVCRAICTRCLNNLNIFFIATHFAVVKMILFVKERKIRQIIDQETDGIAMQK